MNKSLAKKGLAVRGKIVTAVAWRLSGKESLSTLTVQGKIVVSVSDPLKKTMHKNDTLFQGHRQMHPHNPNPKKRPKPPPEPKPPPKPPPQKKPEPDGPQYDKEGNVTKGWEAYDPNHNVKPIPANKRPAAKWHHAKLEDEHEELKRTADDLGLDFKKLHQAALNAHHAPLEDHHWKKLENTDSWETDSHKKVHKMAKNYDRDINSIVDGFNKGHSMPTPIVVHRDGKNPYLVGGNTRLMAARAMGIKPHVKHVRYET